MKLTGNLREGNLREGNSSGELLRGTQLPCPGAVHGAGRLRAAAGLPGLRSSAALPAGSLAISGSPRKRSIPRVICFPLSGKSPCPSFLRATFLRLICFLFGGGGILAVDVLWVIPNTRSGSVLGNKGNPAVPFFAPGGILAVDVLETHVLLH